MSFTAQGVPNFFEGRTDAEVAQGSTLAHLLESMRAPGLHPEDAKDLASLGGLIITHNGSYVSPTDVPGRRLADGDRVTVIPLVGGG